MKIKKSRNLNISPKCIDDVGKEDANQLRETVIFTRALSSEISSATPGSVHRAWFSDMNDNLLAVIDEMADKHGIDKKTFRSNCLSTEEYFSRKEHDTAAVPEPTTTPPVKKRPSPVQKRASSPAKKSTGKGHIRKLFTPAVQNKMSRRRLHPGRGPRARANRGESRGCTRSRFSSHGKSSKKRKRSRNRNKYGGRKSQGLGVTLPLPCHPTKRSTIEECGGATTVANSDDGNKEASTQSAVTLGVSTSQTIDKVTGDLVIVEEVSMHEEDSHSVSSSNAVTFDDVNPVADVEETVADLDEATPIATATQSDPANVVESIGVEQALVLAKELAYTGCSYEAIGICHEVLGRDPENILAKVICNIASDAICSLLPQETVLRAGGRGRSTRSGSSDVEWERTCQGHQARFRELLEAESIQQHNFPFSQESSNACASIAMYTAIQYALTPSHLCVQAEDFRRSTTSIGRDIAVETRFIHEEGAGSFIKRDQIEPIFSGFVDNNDRIFCQEYNGHDIYSSSVGLIELLLDGSTQDSKNVAITLNCNGHVFFLANRSDGAFDLIDSLPAEVFGTSSAFRLTCNSHDDLNTALLCLLSSRSTGSPASKWFDAVVYYGQSNTDIDGLETSVNTFIEESRSARGARDARVIEAPSAKSEVGEKRSRLDVAAEIGTSSFDEEQSSSIISASIDSNNPTLEELNDALIHVDKCIKNCDGEDMQKKSELERKKVLLLIKFIPLHIKERPSDETPSGSSRPRRKKKNLSKAAKKDQERKEKEVEKKRKEIRQTWSSTLVNAVSLLGRGVAILERSQLYKEEIDSFKHHHQTLLIGCIDATQPPKPTSKSTFTIVKFMEDNFVHINLLKAATKFMSDEEASHGVVRVLQEKLHFLDTALKTNMSPEAFLREWNRLEEADAEAVRQVICVEGLYVTVEDKKTGEIKRICIVEPGSYWEQNVLTGVQLYRLAVALKNWHPPIKEKKKEGMTKKEDDDVEMEVDNKSEKKEAAKPNLKNGCLRGVNELGPRIVHIEGGGEMTEEFRQQVIKGIAIFDLHDLFPKTKKYWDMEFTEFARLSGLGSFINFQLRGMVRLQAQLVLNKLCGQRSHMATFSAQAARAGFTIPYGAGVSADVTNAGTLPHGEAQCEPKIKMASNLYSYQDLLNHSVGLCALFSPIAGMCISFMSVAMAIIARRHNDHHLSEEDEELLRNMKRQWCVDGYNAAIEAVSIKYSEEFSKYCEDILDVDVTSENVDPKEIYECQKSFFGSLLGGAMTSVAAAFVRAFEKLDNDVKASNNAFSSEITSLITPHLKKRERAKYDNLLKHFNLNELLSKMKSRHDGSEKSGSLATVAAAFSRIYDEELDNDIKASYNAFSSEAARHIIPHLDDDESEKYETLSKQYANQSELLSKMNSCHDGSEKGSTLGRVAATFSRIFDEELDNDVKASYNAFSSEVTSHIIPLLGDDMEREYTNLLKHYDNNQSELLSKLKSHQSGVQKSIDSRKKNKTADGRSESNIKAAAKQRELGNSVVIAKKRKAEEGYLDKGMLPYSDSRVPSTIQPIVLECPRGNSCTRKGVRMTEHVFYDDGSGRSNSSTGYVASKGWKHVLNPCGATGCGTGNRLVPADEANKKVCIRYDTVKLRAAKKKSKNDTSKKKRKK